MALGALGLAGVQRRRRRRSSRHASGIPLAAGFAAPTGEEQLYEAQATDLASSVLAELGTAGDGLQNTRLVGAYAGRSGASLLLFLSDDRAHALGQAAQSAGARAKLVAPGLYAWEQGWPPVGQRSLAAPDHPLVNLVPLGLAADHRVLYVERSVAGPLLVAGERSAGVYDLFEYLVVDEARRKLPDALYLLTIGTPTRLSPELAELPHQRAGIVDPADTAAVEQLLDELQSELERRLQTGQNSSPDVLWSWTNGPICRRVVLCQTCLRRMGARWGSEYLPPPRVARTKHSKRGSDLFATRLVLRVPSETARVRLLGEPGAEGGVGHRQPADDGTAHTSTAADLTDEYAHDEVADDQDDEAARQVAVPDRDASDADTQPVGDGDQNAACTSIVGKQLALIRAVVVPNAGSSPSAPEPDDGAAVVYRVLGGHEVVANGQAVQPEITYRLAWEVGAAIAALPPGPATTDTLFG